ncbi:probable polygalacturonase At3g15720 [Pyrus x bretschneideri]|uniref:probable polygalacturonase At3g15720 n=1 Tax=Pyrus x bretschneideri TaxID=225117 RepID=UPI00202E770E|nr:probable polygalacturonase At3g15720 [Pyrus x bretschneideri]
MQEGLVSLLIISVALSQLIDIGYSETRYNVLDYGAIGDGQTDDSEAFVKAWKAACGTAEAGDLTTLIVPPETFSLQPVIFAGPCTSKTMHFVVLGNVVAPKTLDAWKKCPSHGWLEFVGVTNLIINGSGTIDGQGSAWWRNENNCKRPKGINFHKCDNLELNLLTHVTCTLLQFTEDDLIRISPAQLNSSPNSSTISKPRVVVRCYDIANFDDTYAFADNQLRVSHDADRTLKKKEEEGSGWMPPERILFHNLQHTYNTTFKYS